MGWGSALSKTQVSAAVEAALARPIVIPMKIDWAHLVVLDFETAFDDDYTLSKLSTSEYVRDPRFKIHMMSIKVGNKKTKVVSGKQVRAELQKIDWSRHDLCCQNTAFDGFILSHHFGVVPRTYFDTLSMARGLYSNDIGASLGEIGEYLGKGNKIEGVLEQSKGVRDLPKALYNSMAVYCARDTDLCHEIFKEMAAITPYSEMELIDITIRMFCDPVLKVDIPRVEKELARELKEREDLLMAIDVSGFPDKDLKLAERSLPDHEKRLLKAKRIVGSSEKFADLLRAEGIVPPVKISPAWIKKPKDQRKDEDKWAYAFAKDDAEFLDLPSKMMIEGAMELGLDRDNPEDVKLLVEKQARVQGLIDVRLAVKSTTNITRAQRFLTAGANGMPLPMGYAYARAHCLLGEAEVLTPAGWERLDHWNGDSEIMQWTPDGGLSFAKSTANVFDISEDMVVSNSRYHRMNYTMGHRIPAFTSTGTFKARQAGDLLNTRCDIPISGKHDGDASISRLDVWLAVMVQADGCVRYSSRSGKCVRFGFKKTRKIERCRYLLNAACIPFTEGVEKTGVTRIYIGSAHVDRLMTYVKGVEKVFSSDLLQAPLKVKQAFVEELMFWDGSTEPHGKGFSYLTTNKFNAEFVHTMAHLCGRSAFITHRVRAADNWSDTYSVYIRGNDRTRSTPCNYSTSPYTGKVYCPTTPTGYFLARQNGLIVVTGNTLRWGGNNKMNMQNLKRGGELRQSILAPKGHVISVVDSGQIEARVNGWLWGQTDLLDAFRASDAGIGRDAYCNFGDVIYGREITKDDKMERFIAKVATLGLGYGMGPDKFQATLAKGALGGPPVFFELTKCKVIVNAYRRVNFRIVAGWAKCTGIIEDMAAGREGSWKCLRWEKERIWGPDGTSLKYPNLKKGHNEETGYDEWTYEAKGVTKKIYGSLFAENICQWLARMVVATQMREIAKKRRVVLMTHDEVGAIAPVRAAAKCFDEMTTAMRRAPEWCADIPLNCEGGWATNYSK